VKLGKKRTVKLGKENKATATTSIVMSEDDEAALAGIDTSSGGGYGVSGTSNNGSGVYGNANNGSGVSGNSTGENAAGVYGISSAEGGSGVYGHATGEDGNGLAGSASGIGGYGVYAYSENSDSLYVNGNAQVTGMLSRAAGRSKSTTLSTLRASTSITRSLSRPT
jgi:hypothetical protein